MKTVKNTLTIIFYLHKGRVNKDGKSPIVARITLNNKRLQISTGKAIEESRWNSIKGAAKVHISPKVTPPFRCKVAAN